MGTCIAQRNYKYFYWYALWGTLMGLYVTACCVAKLADVTAAVFAASTWPLWLDWSLTYAHPPGGDNRQLMLKRWKNHRMVVVL